MIIFNQLYPPLTDCFYSNTIDILFSSEFSEHPSKSPLIKARLRGDVKLNANRLMNSIC